MALSEAHTPPAHSAERDLVVMRGMYFGFYAGAAAVLVFLIQYYTEIIGLNATEIGLVSAIPSAVAIVANPIWGALNDRYGRIRTLLAAAAVCSAGLVLVLALAREFWLIAVITVFFAFFNQPIETLLNGVTIQLLGDRPERYGSIRVWGAVSFVLANLLFGQVMAWAGLQTLFYLYAAGMGLMLVTVVLLHPQKTTLGAPVFIGINRLVRNPAWLLLMSGITLMGVASIGAAIFIVVYLSDLGGSPALVGKVWAVTASAEIPTFFLGAWLLRRFGSNRLLAFSTAVFILQFGLYSLMPTPEWALAIGPIQGLSFAPWLLAGVAVADEYAPEGLKATSQGIFFAALSAASIVTNLISGPIYDATDGSFLFRVFAGIAAAALVVIIAGNFVASRQTRNSVQTVAAE